jgi:S-adenosylmethionine:diacylglycerol 3-amino-3-carboxypropyl transferase
VDLAQGSDWLEGDLPPCRGAVVVAAAEGGDRILRVLAKTPKRIAVVDPRAAQRHLVELKLAALKTLAHPEYLELAGPRPSRRRRALYQRARWVLPKESDEFWLARLGLIDRGVWSQGLLERRLASFRAFVGWVHGSRRVARFRALATEAERREMYAREWKTWLWRRFGAFLWERWFDVPPERLERLLLEGRLLAPPPEIDASVFEAAKAGAPRALVAGSPEEYLRTLPDASVDVFALGRLDVRGLEGEIARVARPGARISVVSDRAPDVRGFRAEGAPAEAGFFPGFLIQEVWAT